MLVRIVIAVMAVLSAGFNVQASGLLSVNELSSGYSQQARHHYSHNDVKAFVYQWFAAFDHQRESGYFLNRLADRPLLNYPGSEPVDSKHKFRVWYQGVMDNIIINSHQPEFVDVSGDQQQGWQVELQVVWQATDKQANEIELRVGQQWRLHRSGDLIILDQLDAKVIDPQ